MEMELLLKYKHVMTDQEKQNLEKTRLEWQDLCESNTKKEVEKEEKYKRFFRDFENNMQQRMNQHLEFVVHNQVAKQQKLDQIEQTNEQKYKTWMEQREQFEKQIRQQGVKDMMDTNKLKIMEHSKKHQEEKDGMKRVIEERMEEEDGYRKYENSLKELERERRKIYKDTLDHQMKLHDYQKNTLGTMTQEEKLMNKLDLNSYKQNEQKQVEALIPGIHNLNTVGSTPLRRGAA